MFFLFLRKILSVFFSLMLMMAFVFPMHPGSTRGEALSNLMSNDDLDDKQSPGQLPVPPSSQEALPSDLDLDALDSDFDSLVADDEQPDYSLHAFSRLPLPIWCEDVFDYFLKNQKFMEIMFALSAYEREKIINNDPSDDISNRIKQWIFQRAEKGHVPLLVFAVHVHLVLQPEPDYRNAMLCIVSSLLRTIQDTSVVYAETKDVYEFVKRQIFIENRIHLGWLVGAGSYLCPEVVDIRDEVYVWLEQLDMHGLEPKTFFTSPGWVLSCWDTLPGCGNFSTPSPAIIYMFDQKRRAVRDYRIRALETLKTSKIKDVNSWADFFAIPIEEFIHPSL